MPHMVHLLKRHPCDLVCVHLSLSRSHSHVSVPPKWDHILCAQLLPSREVQVPPLREPTILLVQILVQELVPFPKPSVLVLPLVSFGGSKPGYIDTVDSDLMHHQYLLSVLQWNPGPARRNPTNNIAAACGRFHEVILQEASDNVPHISDQFIAHTGNTRTSPSCSTRTPSSPTLWFSPSRKTPQAKVRGAWYYSSFEHCRPSLAGTPTVTFCSVHIHNVVAKKRDASTELLQRLHGYMKQHNVDFMGATST